MINAALATQGLNNVMKEAWTNRPTDKATLFDPLHKGYYSVCDWSSEEALFIWCHVDAAWIEVDASCVAGIIERAHEFTAEHKGV